MCLGHLTCTLPQGNTSVQSCPPYISIMPFMGRGVWYMYVKRLESRVPSDWSRHDTVIWHSSVLIGWRLGLMSHKTAILVNIPTVIIFSNSLALVLFCFVFFFNFKAKNNMEMKFHLIHVLFRHRNKLLLVFQRNNNCFDFLVNTKLFGSRPFLGPCSIWVLIFTGQSPGR